MKHSISVVAILMVLFLAAQYIGLVVVDNYVDKETTAATGVVTYKELPGGMERPDIEPAYAPIFIGIAIVIGTVILLFIMKLRKFNLWKIWYLLSVVLSLAIAWAAFAPQTIAAIFAIILGILKVFKSNFIIHNFTELFIYSGLAAIFVPVLNVGAACVLLILISIYDMYAVWKSKHMVAIAQFQASTNLFAGLSIPKKMPALKQSFQAIDNSSRKSKVSKEPVAIIGGGDIGFPLLFAGTVLAQYDFITSLIIPIGAAVGLMSLFIISQKGKFYPAMPFISAGCFLALGIIKLINFTA